MAAKIGDIGRAACPLYPSGRVLIDRAPMAARAEREPIEEGTRVIVVGGDRFCLIVRPFDPAVPIDSLPNWGQQILMGKEDAAYQAELHQEVRRKEEAAQRQLFLKLMWIAAIAGLVVGIGLMTWQIQRAGFSEDLLWIPFLSAISWFCIVVLAFFLGMATEILLVFASIPCAFAGLVLGMWLWGPFVAVVLSFAIGVFVTITSMLIEAMRHPVT